MKINLFYPIPMDIRKTYKLEFGFSDHTFAVHRLKCTEVVMKLE